MKGKTCDQLDSHVKAKADWVANQGKAEIYKQDEHLLFGKTAKGDMNKLDFDREEMFDQACVDMNQVERDNEEALLDSLIE